MHAKSPTLGALVLISLSGQAMALDSWTTSTQRGLATYAVTQAAGSVQIVCDPDRVFGPTPNGAVIVSLPKDKAPTAFVFLAKTGEQARFEVVDGMATQAAADPAEWAKMLAILRNGGEFALVSSLDSLTFETEALPDLDCA
jgi:hypothetical protein